jgi:hypothetical protein
MAGWSGSVYAVGQFSPQFPSLGVEKQLAQLAGHATPGFVETKVLREVLEEPENRFLGRHISWVFTSQQIDAFVVAARDDTDVCRLVKVLPSSDSNDVYHVVVGRAAPPNIDAPPAPSGLPLVVADNILAFTLDEFVSHLTESEGVPTKQPSRGAQPTGSQSSARRDSDDDFKTVVRDVFTRMTRRTGNLGMSDESKALNFVACEYRQAYRAVAQAKREDKMLVDIAAQHSHSTTRRLVAIDFVLRHRRTDITERYQCLVDVTEVFPFLATGLQPTFG